MEVKQQLEIDNRKPDDSNYPSFDEADYSGDQNLIVKVGDYIVNRQGDIVIATTTNAGPYPNEFLRSINEGCFRAKYLGCDDDYLELANQSRLATAAEIKIAKAYVRPDRVKLTQKGQAVLL